MKLLVMQFSPFKVLASVNLFSNFSKVLENSNNTEHTFGDVLSSSSLQVDG
jgi:hypothetical protein